MSIGRTALAATLAAACMVTLPASSFAAALTRVALVVGNSNYANEPKLINPSRDAQAVATALKQAGFQSVTLITDADVATLNHALHDFQDRALGADVAVLYYAGHGMEMNGTNYLIPIDAKLKTDRDLSYEAVTQDLAQQAAGGAKLLSLVVLDACRDNPFASQMTITSGGKRSMSRGLAPVNEDDLSANSIIEYAAQSGTTASDGEPSAGHSPFASAFIRHVPEPGVEITLLFGKVRDDVWKATNEQQRPASYGSHGGDPVYLVPPDARVGFTPTAVSSTPRSDSMAAASPQTQRGLGAAPAPFDPAQSPEMTLWQRALEFNTPTQYQDYLAQYPSGQYAAIAQQRLTLSGPMSATGLSDRADAAGNSRAVGIMQQGNVAEALAVFRASAAAGSAFGQYELGLAYAHGRGVAQDDAQAMTRYRAASAHGYAPAQNNLGVLYQKGEGVPVDLSEAAKWYHLAADQGYAVAQNNIGALYGKGLGVGRDDAEALRWYRLAASGGNTLAMANLGHFYMTGRAVAQDYGAAFQWYSLAAARGNPVAQAHLGLMYFQGRGVERDPGRARTLMVQAAAQGSGVAKSWLQLNPG
jgi:TPR repeat protein